MPVNKVTKDFPVQQMSTVNLLNTFTQLQDVGSKGKEWIAIREINKQFTPVLVKKTSWLGRLFQRICGKDQYTRLHNVSNYLIKYLKENENTLLNLNDTDFQKVNKSLILLERHFKTKSPELIAKINGIINTHIQNKSTPVTEPKNDQELPEQEVDEVIMGGQAEAEDLKGDQIELAEDLQKDLAAIEQAAKEPQNPVVPPTTAPPATATPTAPAVSARRQLEAQGVNVDSGGNTQLSPGSKEQRRMDRLLGKKS